MATNARIEMPTREALLRPEDPIKDPMRIPPEAGLLLACIAFALFELTTSFVGTAPSVPESVAGNVSDLAH